jgi:site-specific DNA-methyltransferase (adenine-specific)
MFSVALEEILVSPTRQRKDILPGPLKELRDSIAALGLLHPPVVAETYDEDTGEITYQLIAGERRLEAIRDLAIEGTVFRCDGKVIMPGQCPVTLVTDLTASELFAAELEENLLRVDLSWQERTQAIAALRRLRLAENPDETKIETARAMIEKSGGDLENPPPGMSLNTLSTKIKQAEVLAQHLHLPSVAKARNENEAYQIVLKQESARVEAEVLRRLAAKGGGVRLTIRTGDCLEMMPLMDDGLFDLILTDPPYGINAHGGGFRDRSAIHHNYDDTASHARAILRSVLSEGHRLTRPKANIFIFTDISHFEFLQIYAAQQGWVPWRYPVIWQKSVSEGLAPWGRSGFIHTYDVIFWATKGQRGLLRPHLDVLTYSRVNKQERTHAAEKPVELLRLLIELSTIPGETVFDPCAGSGSTIVAAKSLGRHAEGIELDPGTADAALVRVEGTEQEAIIVPRDPQDLSDIP